MRYIRVKDISIENKEKFDKYHYYFNNDLKEVELNKAFTLTKQVLSQILEISTITEVILTIIVKDDNLDYLIGYDDNIDMKFSNVTIQSIEPLKVDYQYKSNLYGIINPRSINLKEINLIDELLIENKNKDFSIEIRIKKDLNKGESNLYLLELADIIEELSSKSEVNINEQDMIIKSFFKTIIGGEGKSFKKERVDGKKKLSILKEKYEVLSVNQHIFKVPSIRILTNDKETNTGIESKIISYSKMNIGNSEFYISADSEYIKQVQYITLDYVIPLIAFPMTNVAGLTVSSKYEYGAEILPESNNNIILGKLNKNGNTKIDVNYDINDLLMHTFVTGVTGSGKTSTIKKILYETVKAEKPFLIIEPAKSEYKYLKNLINIKRYQLGIEKKVNFRLNPFEFPENINIQTHLDNIKSVFVAAFPMQGPMPYILETAFYNIYRKKGWDLLSNINIYSNILDTKYLYPTLEDLYEEIDNVTDDVGYSQELTDDVKGALKVRVGSLLSGAKGAILNTNESSKMEIVLEEPTIIELESIGDSQEKVFFMGLILISMYEHYISKGKYSDELQNLLVIEEAHRLLENTTTSNNNEIADMKGKALENFNNILSEIRAYGQGIIIADQIPAKLSPDVIKNTNLKIIHRLYANDDRELIGGSIGLEDDKLNGFIALEKGQAIIFHSKIKEPLKVDINIEDKTLLEKEFFEEEDEIIRLDFANIVCSNEIVIRQIATIINAHLLSKNSNYISTKECIKKIIQIYYDAEIIESYKVDIDSIVKSILIKYVKSAVKDKEYIITYPNQLKFIDELMECELPLDYFKNNFDRYIKLKQQSEAINLVNNYELIRLLYSINNKSKFNITLLAKKYEEYFKQGNLNLSNDIINKLNLGEVFKINNLSETDKLNLVDTLVIYYFEDSIEILNLYFDIGTLSKKKVLEEKKIFEEENMLTNSINSLVKELNKINYNNSNEDLATKVSDNNKLIIKNISKDKKINMIINGGIIIILIIALIFK